MKESRDKLQKNYETLQNQVLFFKTKKTTKPSILLPFQNRIFSDQITALKVEIHNLQTALERQYKLHSETPFEVNIFERSIIETDKHQTPLQPHFSSTPTPLETKGQHSSIDKTQQYLEQRNKYEQTIQHLNQHYLIVQFFQHNHSKTRVQCKNIISN